MRWPSLVVAAALALAAPACARADAIGSALPIGLPPSTGKIFYVAPTGSDRNRGTRKRPWRTIQKALDRLQPGQRAYVRAGTYTQDLVMSRSGTAAAPITIAAFPGERVVLHAASTTGDTYPVRITGSYFRLHGFVVEQAIGVSSTDVYIQGSANHVEISGSELRYSQDQGLFAERTTSYVFIVANRIHDNGWGHVEGQHQSHGMYVEGSYDVIADNVIYNQPYGFGIQLYPANHDTVVVDNTAVRNGHSGIVVGGPGGVYNITIRNNIFAFNGSWGIETDSRCPSAITIDHNLLFGNPGGGIRAGCAGLDTAGGNVESDPLFVDGASNDLRIQPVSPAVAQALAEWSEPFDATGRRRPASAPSIGAYEPAFSIGAPGL